MRKIIIIMLGVLIFQSLNAQTYYSFPTDTAKWDCLFWHQWSPSNIILVNNRYTLQGDTIINGITYKKTYWSYSNESSQLHYIGGMREDSTKNIYFFPFSRILPTITPIRFPTSTSESLLYTFNNLEIGMVLPINLEVTQIKVVDIDSILLGDTYRKRYKIEQNQLSFGDHYWIEGIGSTKDLFASYSEEFEWQLYTLCYTDSLTYYINSPNGEDSCHYWIPVGIKDLTSEKLVIFPNPASQTIKIETCNTFNGGIINIYNNYGQKIFTKETTDTKIVIDIHKFESGLYFVEVIDKNRKLISKFLIE